MKNLLLILCLFPLPHFAKLYVDFSNLSYSEVFHAIQHTKLSNINIIIHHPYNKKIGMSLSISQKISNYFDIELTTLQQQVALQKNKLYLIINPFTMNNNSIFTIKIANNIFIPDIFNPEERKILKKRLLQISQYGQFSLIIDMQDIPTNSKKHIEKFIKKISPDIIFLHGSTDTISEHYYQKFISNPNSLYIQKSLPQKEFIHKLPTKHTGQNLALLFYLLSQKYHVLIDYTLLKYQYALNLVYIAENSKKKFKTSLLNNQLIIYNNEYFSIINNNPYLQIQEIPNNYIGESSKPIIKNIVGSSPLYINSSSLRFLIWPKSILVWAIKK